MRGWAIRKSGYLTMGLYGRHAAAALLALPLLLQGAHATEARLKGAAPPTPHSAVLWEQGRLSYDLDAVRRGAALPPPVFATALPEDIGEIADTAQKKRTFIRLVLPLVMEANARILANRHRLLEISRQGVLTREDRLWIQELAWDYGMDGTPRDLVRPLLLRVDIIPPSLAIAQSITESGWGTSRFAQDGRALYGQRTWSRGDGIVPERRRSGENFEVKAFRSLLESVNAYMRNLNTHPAYAELRRARAEMRREGRLIDGYRLAGHLTRYAETGQVYVDDLRLIMRVNDLRDFDRRIVPVMADRVARNFRD